jgi:beta-glucosidase
MVHDYAKAVAEEFRARHMHILLGPGINIYRSPLCGRNYEYMGEDPFLVASMVVPYVEAVESVRVLPVVKHIVANNSENKRKNSNSVVDERTLREIYFPGFKAAVQKSHTPAIMNAYNLLNGVYCGENSWLLKDVLRKEWGFNGMVISDWHSLWNSELAARSGCDIEMPGGQQVFVMSPDSLKRLLNEGKITEKDIDEKVSNLIRPCIKYDLYDKNWADPALNKRDEHAKVALKTAREGITLLKNEDDLLPLLPEKAKKIVVIGPTAAKTPTTGGGSGGVTPENPVSIWDGMKNIYGDKAVLLTRFDAQQLKDADAVVVCVGLNTDLVLKNYNSKNGKVPKSIAEEQASFNKKEKDPIEGEGHDRSTFGLPEYQNNLIKKCAAANKNAVVMITAGGAVDMMPWIDSVKSIVWMYYPGQNGSQAAAEIVAGEVNPSGKLPFTYDKRLEDNAAYGNFGLKWGNNGKPKYAGYRPYWDVHYDEGIFLGYRHYDKENMEPLFPFGHGLSYTTFKYDDLKINKEGDKVLVTFKVTNTGDMDGAEIAQLYVGDQESSVPRPVKELKGFKKVFLKKGETKTITIELDPSDFSFWDPETKQWTMEPGVFDILVGSSSRDIRLNKTVSM